MVLDLHALSGLLSPSRQTLELLFFDVVLKPFIILAFVYLLVLSCRRASASIRHRLWTLGVCCAVALPVISICVPSWSISVLPKHPLVEASQHQASNGLSSSVHDLQQLNPKSQVATIPKRPLANAALRTPSSTGSSASLSAEIEARESAEPAPERVSGEVSPVAAGHPPAPQASPAKSTRWALTTTHWSLVVWLTVSGLLLVRLAVSCVQTIRLTGRASSVDDERVLAIAQQCLALLSARSRVRVVESSSISTPVATGVFRGKVVLPLEARTWSDPRLKGVLLHELAHIARRDVLSQLAAGFCCAVYWFNPLAWMAASSLQREREQACDDQVLQHGMRPSDYAQQLLQMAQFYRRNHQHLLTAAMARPCQIEQRIHAILDSARPRTGFRAPAAVIVGVAFCLATSLLAALNPVSGADEDQPLEYVIDTGKQLGNGVPLNSGLPRPNGRDRLLNSLPRLPDFVGWFEFGEGNVGSIVVARLDDVDEPKLYVDVNRDQVFSEQERAALVAEAGVSEGSRQLTWMAEIPKYRQSDAEVHTLRFRINRSTNGMLVTQAGHLIGHVNKAGQDVPARLFDANCNRSFSDAGDRIQLDLNGDGHFSPLREKFACRSVVRIDGDRFTLGFFENERRVKLRPLSGTGSVIPTVTLAGADAEVSDFHALLVSDGGIHVPLNRLEQASELPVGWSSSNSIPDHWRDGRCTSRNRRGSNQPQCQIPFNQRALDVRSSPFQAHPRW